METTEPVGTQAEATMEQVCAREGCDRPATKHCPVCQREGLPPAYFCSQECFKVLWATHKDVHNPKPIADPRFEGYEFSGSLRPGTVSAQHRVPDSIMKPDYAVTSRSITEERSRSEPIEIKSPAEIAKMRVAGRVGPRRPGPHHRVQVAREILDLASSHLRVGVTTDEIDQVVYEECVRRGVYPSPLNYYGFPKSLCTSVNEVVCHGIPDSRPLKDGDIVNLDITIYVNGYHGDVNETFFIGNVSEEDHRLVEATYISLKNAVESVKPGMRVREIGEIIQNYIERFGYSIDRTYCGHGIGSLFHCNPTIPHYRKNQSKGVLQPGMTFTIEPMINRGKHNDTQWPDGWTVVTQDGQRSAQFEHTLLMTEKGAELLTEKAGHEHMEWDPKRFQR